MTLSSSDNRISDIKDLVSIILPENFMRKFSKFSSLEELLEAGNYSINSLENMDKINLEELNDHIQKNTKFGSLNDMIQTAKTALARYKLGL